MKNVYLILLSLTMLFLPYAGYCQPSLVSSKPLFFRNSKTPIVLNGVICLSVTDNARHLNYYYMEGCRVDSPIIENGILRIATVAYYVYFEEGKPIRVSDKDVVEFKQGSIDKEKDYIFPVIYPVPLSSLKYSTSWSNTLKISPPSQEPSFTVFLKDLIFYEDSELKHPIIHPSINKDKK